MRFKLDENFGNRTQSVFQSLGHDIQTVRDEGLEGSPDQNLFSICCAEDRCLVTLDLDFSDVTRFPPADSSGIAVIRVPQNPSLSLLEQMIRRFLETVEHMPISGNLWIVEVGRIRIHQDQ